MADSTGRNALADCIQRVTIDGQSDLVFDVECFTDDSGTTFYGVWELSGGTLALNFYTVDAGGNLTPYAPTSTPVPCVPDDIETTQECWIALADGVGYNQNDQIQQIHFWDTTSTPPTLTATIWYNQTTRTVIAAAPPNADLAPCATRTIVSEVGCLSDPAAADLTNVDKCRVDEVIIDGVSISLDPDLEPGWTAAQLVDAVNAVVPGTLVNEGGLVVSAEGKSITNLEIVCIETDFTEDFGTTAAVTYTAVPGGATTTYTLDPTGFLAEDQYAVARVKDGRPGVFDMGQGAAGVDATGDTDGRVLMVNGSPNPGEFYRQVITGLVQDQEYTFRAFVANGNDPATQSVFDSPDVTLQIQDGATLDVLATIDTGPVFFGGPIWQEFSVNFVANVPDIEISLINNSGVASGNDVLIDQITFSRVSRTLVKMASRGALIPVEIVKELNADQSIVSLRVWSPDGQTEYVIPDPDGKVLSTGRCEILESAAEQTGGEALPACYEDANGNFFDAVVTLNIDGTVDTMVVNDTVTDPSPGTLIVGRPCEACCVPSDVAETFEHVGLPHDDIATAAGFLAGTTTYNGNLCGDTVRLVPFDLTVVDTEAATSPEPIFTWEDVENGGSHRIVLSGSGTLRMGFASANAAIGETFVFTTHKPDRIFPGVGSTISDQATLDSLSLPITWSNGNSSNPTYFEWDNVTAVQFTVNSQDGVSMRAFVDSVTFDEARRWAIDDCCPDCDKAQRVVTIGYLQSCTPFDITLPINEEASFSDSLSATTTISTTSSITQLLISQLRRAQEYEQAEVNAGIPVTNFVINTDSGAAFEFPPSAWIAGNTLEFTTADLVLWAGPLTDIIVNIQYSVLDGCECGPVEMVQRIEDDDSLTLLGIYRPNNFGADGRKELVPTPLEFGVTGPFAGQCPQAEQVLSVEELCCDNDLASNNPDIANQRLAWLDGADASLMLDAVGGSPIAGNDGDQVFEVQDKLAPGVAPSFRIPATGAPGDIPPINPPTYSPSAVNGLSVLEFDSANRERIRLDTNNAAGNSFTLLYLFSAVIDGQASQSILAVGPNHSDTNSFITTGGWQLSRDGFDNTFVFRLGGTPNDPDPVDVSATFSPATDLSWAAGAAQWEQTIAPMSEAYNGQLHLLTATYDNVTNDFKIFFDGDLRYHGIANPASDGFANIGSDYFRIFGNRQGDSFSTGQLAEMFFADSAMTDDDVAAVNAYLICKWGIDPSLAAGGAGDLTLAPAGTYDAPTPFRRVTRGSGEIAYLNTNNGLEFPVPPVPGLSICDDGSSSGGTVDGCCDQPDITFDYSILTAGGNVTHPANTLNSLSVQVLSGTADINGTTIPAGPPINVSGDAGQNNIATAHTIDNVTGDTLIITGQY